MKPSPTVPPPAVIYGRLSRGDSALESHEAKNLQYLALRDFDLACKFEDEDTSGGIAILDRTGGAALFRRLERGDIRHLVVAKLDRLGRKATDILLTIEALERLKVTLHIVDFGGDTITTQGHMGKLILTFFAGVAEWERNEIRGRTRAMAEYKFDHGELNGTIPYGFDCEYQFPDGHTQLETVALNPVELGLVEKAHGGECVAKRVLDNPGEQDIIRKIAAWRVGGDGYGYKKKSYQWIADQLNASGIPSKAPGRLLVRKNGDRLTAKGTWQCGNLASLLQSKHTLRLLQASEPLAAA